MAAFPLPELNDSDYRLALKYLSVEVSPETVETYFPPLKSVAAEIAAVAQPRVTSVCFPTAVNAEGFYTIEPDIVFESRDLAAMLTECHHLLLMGVTLGSAVDTQNLKLQLTRPTDALYWDALAGVYAEELLNRFLQSIRAQSAPGEYFSSPYSCGYGDLSINMQPILLHLLNAEKQIGVTLSPSNMMSPIKSITSIVGISRLPQRPSYGCLKCKRSVCDPNCPVHARLQGGSDG